MTVVVAILGLIFLIIVHELGHMLTAKALGVRVPEFGVGFGPPLFKKKIGESVYSLRIVLLGGFAKMAGMNDGAEGPDTFPAKSAWRRALIIFAGPLANILTAVVILAVVLMTTGVITGVKPEVRQIEPNSMAERVGIQPGDRFVAVDGTRIKGWDNFEREVQ
jgi:regulator of sigma E protease